MSSNRRSNEQDNPSQTSAAISSVTQSISFSGPLLPPALLAKYNEVIPNGADRIMAMAERQGAHREALEAKVVAANVASQARGSHYAFIICLVTIVGGFVLIGIGKSIIGVSAVIGSLAALAGVFLIAKSEQRRERAEKQDALNSRQTH